jgi:putative two-component system response regulator
MKKKYTAGEFDREFDWDGTDYLAKAPSPPLPLGRASLQIQMESLKRELEQLKSNVYEVVTEKIRTALELQNTVLSTMSHMVECRDDLTGEHLKRICLFLRLLLQKMLRQGIYADELAGWDINLFIQAAQLHDVGKIALLDSVLLKPTRLTAAEFDSIKQHTIFGERIIEKIQQRTQKTPFLTYAWIIAGTHHEKWDGSGYPRGLTGRGIPLHGRLMALADVYDTLISRRPYKSALTAEQAGDIIEQESGRHFDPILTTLFTESRDEFQALYLKRTIPTDADIAGAIARDHVNLHP